MLLRTNWYQNVRAIVIYPLITIDFPDRQAQLLSGAYQCSSLSSSDLLARGEEIMGHPSGADEE